MALLKVIKVTGIKLGDKKGLFDSGATNIVRSWRTSDSEAQLKVVDISLAAGFTLKMTVNEVGSLIGRQEERVEPIIPLLHLTRFLKCQI